MVKKLFALASVTALTGLIAAVAASGCSSTTTVDPGTPETGTDAKPTPKEAAPPDPPEEAGAKTCPEATPITAADIEAQSKWLPPAPTSAVCTQKNMDDFKALFAKGAPTTGLTFKNINTVLGPDCAACAFSAKTATQLAAVIIEGRREHRRRTTRRARASRTTLSSGRSLRQGSIFELGCVSTTIVLPHRVVTAACASDVGSRGVQEGPRPERAPASRTSRRPTPTACPDDPDPQRQLFGTIVRSHSKSAAAADPDGGKDAAAPPQ